MTPAERCARLAREINELADTHFRGRAGTGALRAAAREALAIAEALGIEPGTRAPSCAHLPPANGENDGTQNPHRC